MNRTFHHTLLNGPFGDPCLVVRLFREKRSLLFDLGDIHALSPSALNRITHVFVTHTHIDHFIGFDTLLRGSLWRTTPLAIYGPRGIIRNVQGKLSGYAWNLIEQYPVSITVNEYTGKGLTHARFRAETAFRKEAFSRMPSDGLLLDEPEFTVRAAVLDHGIPCLAYALEEKRQLNIDKDRLIRKGLSVGPWLTLFKKQVREGQTGDQIRIHGNLYQTGELLDIVRTREGQKICYATDIRISRSNRERLLALADHADTFYCEAYFMEKDRGLSLERPHLTAHECGRLARTARVKKLVIMHVSPRYHHEAEEVLKEAAEAFGESVSY